MATDDVNIAEDAEMAECDGDKVVTMMDVLQEQQDFEEDANAVLGASDDKNCTYPKGYIKRQALYACLTCCTEAKTDPTKRAGVCLACSLNCHENHELVELYTKRNFRCDCGNPKFNSNPCQFTPDKTDLNEDNVYNQNFSGLYCTCHRPYPDPESTVEDDMIQCIICEDWLHASHLDAVVPANDQYSEMICKSCMEKNEFLHDYSMFAVTVETGDVDIVTVNGDAKATDNSICNGDLENEKLTNGIDENKTESEPANVTINGDVEMSEDKGKDDAENKTVEQNSSEVNTEEKQTDLSNVESESKSEDKEKADNDDSMALDTDSKTTEQEDQPTESTETKGDDEVSEESFTEKENLDTEKETLNAQSDDKSEAAVTTSEDKPDQSNDKNAESSHEDTGNTNENTDIKPDDSTTQSTDIEPQKTDEAMNDQSEKQNEGGDGDKVQSLTETSEEKSDNSVAEEKQEEKMEQSEGGDNVPSNTTESAEEITKAIESSDQTQANESTTEATNIEVPDTSQPAETEKENPEDKTDSVMDAIDELLETSNAKETVTEEQKEETKIESSESKEESSEENKIESTESKVESTEEKESKDVDMTPDETQPDKVPENTDETAEPDSKITTSNDTDVEMNDNTAENKPASEDKQNDEPEVESDGKDDKTEEVGKSDDNDKPDATINEDKPDATVNEDKPDATENEDKLDSDSVAEKDEKSLVETDTANETISQDNTALNETDNELKTTTENGSTKDNEGSSAIENAKEHKRKLPTDITDDSSSKKAKLECVRPKGVKRVHKGATFWPSNFRQKLCPCGECISMYNDLKVLYLTDLEDTVFAYESLGKENVAGGASQYEKGLQALSSLDRIQQINALTEYNRMRDKLLDFLKSFKDRKEIVKEEDIKAFFAGMKPRREPDGVYFCR